MNLFHRNKESHYPGENTSIAPFAPYAEHIIEQFLISHLRNANLQRKGSIELSAPDLRFTSNEEFWKRVLVWQQISLRWVELIHYQIADWFPRTPGLYYSDNAEWARKEAERFVSNENGVLFYEPRGKFHMIQGGIGSVHFKPIVIEGNEHWLCTATSDGYCHSGVPIAIPNSLMEQIDFGADQFFTITGQVNFLPEFLESYFYHMSGIPQIYVLVDHIKRSGKDKGVPIKITPMVFFTGEQSGNKRGNVTYVTCNANSLGELDRATEWLTWYVERYSGEVITNFDQQRPTFENAPFSLQNVMNGKVDGYRLNEFHINNARIICDTIEKIHAETMTMSKIQVKLGDGTTIYGDFVIANAIKDSFNKAASAEISNDLKDLLKSLAKEVGKITANLPEETAQQVVRDLETLTVEATSKAPRKKWWELSLEGLKEVAKTVGEIGKPILEILSQIIPLLTSMSS